jgi:hypothetical protein
VGALAARSCPSARSAIARASAERSSSATFWFHHVAEMLRGIVSPPPQAFEVGIDPRPGDDGTRRGGRREPECVAWSAPQLDPAGVVGEGEAGVLQSWREVAARVALIDPQVQNWKL